MRVDDNHSTFQVETPGKLNLFLEVLRKREDGFHEIETLMMAVSIYDTLYFTANSEGKLKFGCNWASGMEVSPAALGAEQVAPLGDLPRDGRNIVWKALECFRQAAGVESGATVRLIKRIPTASGLGGASSDAAAVLVAANRVWEVGWTQQRLSKLAADLGSDIPFFLSSGPHGNPIGICRGRGERIEMVPCMTRLHFVIVRPPVGLSTPAVYAGCSPTQQPVAVAPLVEALQRGSFRDLGCMLRNRLESAAEKLSPWVERLRSEFAKLHMVGHQMTGSGSGYFGICRHAHHARRSAGLLRAARIGHVFHVTSTSPSCRISRIPA